LRVGDRPRFSVGTYWRQYPKNAWIINILEKIAQWSPIAWYLVDVMFIMNSWVSSETLKTENANVPRQRFLISILGVLAIAAVVFTIITGKLLVNESDSQYDWRKDTAVQAQRLVWLAGGARTFVDSEGDSLHYL